MKKILILLWIIIIGGAIFIGINVFGPKTETTTTDQPSDTNIEIEINIADLPKDQQKSYSEYIDLGDNYMEEEDYENAAINYTYASQINPNSSATFHKLGLAQLSNHQPTAAITSLSQATKLKPDDEEIKISLARAQLNSNNIEQAKDIFWTLDEENSTVRYYTAITLILYKDFEGAKNKFEEITSENSTAPSSTKEKSQLFLDQYEQFSYYTESDTLFLQTLLGQALIDTEEHEAAIPLLFDVITQKNNYRDAWILLGYAYLASNQPEDAIYALSQAETLAPTKPQTLFFLGLAYFANDDINNAISYLEKADSNGYEPKDEINLRLGDLYTLQEEYEKSAQKYEKVISLNTDNIDVFTKLVWLNIDILNDPKKALEYADEALRAHPGEAMAYNLKGWALTALGRYTEAKKQLAKALEVDDELEDAFFTFGWLYERKNNIALAKEYYKQAYILGNGNPTGNKSALRFNELTKEELKNYYKANISQP